MIALSALLAILIERVFAYPEALRRLIRHPVEWMGAQLGWLEMRLNRPSSPRWLRIVLGGLTLIAALLVFTLPAWGVSWGLAQLQGGWIVEGLLAASLLAWKGLEDAVVAVRNGLGTSLEQGRRAVSQIVGRATSEMDESQVAGAAIESLAENSSDGVVAPLFYFLIFGLPGIVAYKVINTADSMHGHRNERFRDFGAVAANVDDLVNFLPARITGFLIAYVSGRGKNRSRAGKVMMRDAGKHVSLNAGWPEAAMAGALDVTLGGPRTYNGKLLNLPKMGNGRRNLTPDDITTAIGVIRSVMAMIALFLAAIVAGLMWFELNR